MYTGCCYRVLLHIVTQYIGQGGASKKEHSSCIQGFVTQYVSLKRSTHSTQVREVPLKKSIPPKPVLYTRIMWVRRRFVGCDRYASGQLQNEKNQISHAPQHSMADKQLALSGLDLLPKRCDLAAQNRHGPASKCENVRSNQPQFLVSSRFRYLPRKNLDSIVHIQMWTMESEVRSPVQNI